MLKLFVNIKNNYVLFDPINPVLQADQKMSCILKSLKQQNTIINTLGREIRIYKSYQLIWAVKIKVIYKTLRRRKILQFVIKICLRIGGNGVFKHSILLDRRWRALFFAALWRSCQDGLPPVIILGSNCYLAVILMQYCLDRNGCQSKSIHLRHGQRRLQFSCVIQCLE